MFFEFEHIVMFLKEKTLALFLLACVIFVSSVASQKKSAVM